MTITAGIIFLSLLFLFHWHHWQAIKLELDMLQTFFVVQETWPNRKKFNLLKAWLTNE